jgi:hypothetical protein
MRAKLNFRVVAFVSICILLLTSCNSEGMAPIESLTAAVTQQQSSTAGTEETTGGTPEPSQTEEITFTPTLVQPTPMPIVETRLSPDQWRNWPVVPELTGREIEIFQRGLALGNDPTHFSKVGDCQAIKDVLMGIYDTPSRYYLAAGQAYLQETIDYFSGSFNRDGQGVRGGYNAAAVISPIWADPEVCNPGETPIECEYRTFKPSFVIISLEVWWEGRTTERYKDYMSQIIEFFIDSGVVPILATKADNVEGDHRINLATAELAYEYHIPLWNFWRAVQDMPNKGLRDDFHISYDAWTVRSFTALQALDAVWRGVQEVETTVVEATTEAAENAVKFSPIQISPTPQASSEPFENERWVFSLSQHIGEVTRSTGIYTFDLTDQTLYQIFDAGFQLEDVDRSGTRLLVSWENELYLSDLDGAVQLLTDRFAHLGAFWLPDDSRFILLTDEEEGRSFWLVDPFADTWQLLAEGEIDGIVEPTGSGTFYWYKDECGSSESVCEGRTIWRIQADISEPFFEAESLFFSYDGNAFVWVETQDNNYLMLNTASADKSTQDYHYFPGNLVKGLVWSPVDESLVLLTATLSDYSGKSSDANVFLVDTSAMSYIEYHSFSGLNPDVYWNEAGDQILLVSTLLTEEGYRISVRQTDLISGLYDTLEDILVIQSEDFIKIDELFWITP